MRSGAASRGSQRYALRTILALILAATALTLSACGSSDSEPTAVTPPDNLVTSAELHKGPADGVEHAFLEFWSGIQFQSWAEVASFYDPAFREFIGTASIIGGKKLNAASYQNLKPEIAKITKAGKLTTIKYSLQFADGSKELDSISWLKDEGNWQIAYDSRLDAELNQFAENRVELATNGVLPTEISEISPAATRAGAIAAQAQARFLQQQLGVKGP